MRYIFYYCKNTLRLWLVISRLSKVTDCRMVFFRKVSKRILNENLHFARNVMEDITYMTYDL